MVEAVIADSMNLRRETDMMYLRTRLSLESVPNPNWIIRGATEELVITPNEVLVRETARPRY